VLFSASPALFYGASDDCVEVESGFAGSCIGVCAAFGSIDLKVVELAERFVKSTPAVVGVAVGWRVDRARSSHGMSQR
jgi:hypothetical protein